MGTCGEAPQEIEADPLSGPRQPRAGGDDEDSRDARRGIREGLAVGELATKVEAAQEGEDLPERRAFSRADAFRQLEPGPVVEEQPRPLPSAGGRREQEDPAHPTPPPPSP